MRPANMHESPLLSLIAARDPDAMARLLRRSRGPLGSSAQRSVALERLEEAVIAAFLNFLGRAAEADPSADPRDLLVRATREAAASRIEVDAPARFTADQRDLPGSSRALGLAGERRVAAGGQAAAKAPAGMRDVPENRGDARNGRKRV